MERILLEDEETTPRPQSLARPLDRLGIAELEAYVGELRHEIARAEAEIGRKRTIQAAAHGVFKI